MKLLTFRYASIRSPLPPQTGSVPIDNIDIHQYVYILFAPPFQHDEQTKHRTRPKSWKLTTDNSTVGLYDMDHICPICGGLSPCIYPQSESLRLFRYHDCRYCGSTWKEASSTESP